jgi:hypothetical protein
VCHCLLCLSRWCAPSPNTAPARPPRLRSRPPAASPAHPAQCTQDTIVAISKGGDKLVVGNVDAGTYPTMEFSTDPAQVRMAGCADQHVCVCVCVCAGRAHSWLRRARGMTLCAVPPQAVDTRKHSWANYFVSAYKGVFEHLQANGAEPPAPVGLQVMVHGVVPLGEWRACCCVAGIHPPMHGMARRNAAACAGCACGCALRRQRPVQLCGHRVLVSAGHRGRAGPV